MKFARRAMSALGAAPDPQPVVRRVLQILLGAALLFAGTGHLTFARTSFRAQVPAWVPLDVDVVVVSSGVVEILLGLGLILLVTRRHRVVIGWVTAAFFVAVFPGNISQYVTHTDAFGLNSDALRALRLPFQPVLVLWALWSTQAWQAWRRRRIEAVAATAAHS